MTSHCRSLPHVSLPVIPASALVLNSISTYSISEEDPENFDGFGAETRTDDLFEEDMYEKKSTK